MMCHQRTKIAGAVAYCKGKRLTKKCLYENKTKYLVQVSDTVQHLVCVHFFLDCCPGCQRHVSLSIGIF